MPTRQTLRWTIGAVVVLLVCGIMWLGVYFASQVPTRSYDLNGTVVAVHPEAGIVTVHNENMPGLMAPMNMDYQLKDRQAISNLKPGDQIHATLKTDQQSTWELQNISVRPKP